MDKKSLIGQAEIFKKEADLLLEKSKILQLLKQYGKIRFTGSYQLNLMLNGDIDIHIINPIVTKNSAIDVLNKLVKQGFFNGYLFYDWVKFRKEEFPRGYYIGLKTRFNETRWKIDIWFLRKDASKELKLMSFVEKNLTDENKLTILKFKHFRNTKNLEITSAKIYEAVLREKITTIKGLMEFIEH